MIQTESQIIETAEPMMSPVVYADVREGSGKARFFLKDNDDVSVHAQEHELSRSLFNGCRDNGVLYQDADNPLMVGDHQAWRVRTEVEGDG